MESIERRAFLGDRQAQDMREEKGSYFYSNCAAEAFPSLTPERPVKLSDIIGEG